MSQSVEFTTKDTADQFREEYSDYICSIDDDKRKRTVHFIDDSPEWLIDRAEAVAADDRGKTLRSVSADLTEQERGRIGALDGFG